MALQTYSVRKREKLEDGRVMAHCSLVLGDGSATYPAGGIALDKSKIGLRAYIDTVIVQNDAASSRHYKFEQSSGKLRIFVEGAAVFAEMTGTVPSITLDLTVIGA